jgi:hypothetical protein
MEAFMLRRVDREYEISLQAWMNREVKAQREGPRGKVELVYRDFNKFFDYKKRVDEVKHTESLRAEDSRLRQVARRLDKRRREGRYGRKL